MLTLADYPIVFEQRVAWGDMDAFGHVNNVIYYRYIESARLYYLDHLKILQQDVLTVIASNQYKYIRPVVYPDILKIGVRVEELRNSAMRMHYLIYSEAQQMVVAEADAVIVCVDRVNMQKTLIPENVRAGIHKIEKTVQHILD
ncbi:acyl-CoA thioesterase [Acinetobacter towneri]|uniref:acyl-CoA thioesterase n=1 Tax=Acinetobacter towneri TaxID=202956 RepID=UPI002B25F768|nr:thioesterase family protein [Acinetobacter towneri]WPC32274.1 thioesterase family protein [Acinetobacter towneri]